METTIYQINLEKDVNNIAFRSYERIKENFASEIYEKIFTTNQPFGDLEDVFHTFNVEYPEGYCGRSLSVSDVVKFQETEKAPAKFYYCCSAGFQEVPFDEEKAVYSSHFNSDHACVGR